MRFFAVALLLSGAASYAQTPEVPPKIAFAGMTLSLREDVRREIQNDVDGLTAHGRYFNMKVERARTYFPLIEKIFKEEGVPEDFKYLVLQESALVPDAVSVSNAVGFWQFKDFTALEMGLRVDKDVDERMNLISSTRGAARYLKKSNTGFDNWLLSLQSYQMGAGGVKRSMGESLNGAKKMEITPETYWYVKKFLAHKIAFENSLSGEAQVKVFAYESSQAKTLKEIAEEVSTEEAILRDYNKWLKGNSIPSDKTYTVLIPVGTLDGDFNNLVLASKKASKAEPLPIKKTGLSVRSINAIPVVTAMQGESVVALAERGGVSLSSFLKFNDVAIDYQPRVGETFFLSKKKSKGEQETLKVKVGDDLWSISQQSGVKIKSLRKYNKFTEAPVLAVGSLVWLRSNKPKTEPVEKGQEAKLESETFDWDLNVPKENVLIVAPISAVTPYISPAGPLSPDSIMKSPEMPAPVIIAPVTTTHLVRAGDTYYSISKQYGLEVTQLLAMNNLTIQNSLQSGQLLKVVENEPVKDVSGVLPVDSTLTHEVKSSDTLYSIARQYGVTIKDIMDWNNKKDFSLSRGEKLQIRQGGR